MNTTEIAAAISRANSSGSENANTARAVGSGTWLFGGPVATTTHAVSLHPRSGVIDYTPGDLVISVHAGTTLQELAAITGEHGQMLALAPYGSSNATVGAMLATASAAPLAYDDLTARDLVLGLTVVTGSGDVVRAGGKVVKNVAGFDLVRLNTGAFGTLGVITEASLRLHAKPTMDHVVTGTLHDAPSAWIPRLIANRAPLPMLVRMAPGEPAQLFARCTGNSARASALRGIVQSYGAQQAFTLGPSDTNAVSEANSGATILRQVSVNALVLRARCKPEQGAALISEALRAFPDAITLYHPARGTLRIATSAPTVNGSARDHVVRLATALAPFNGSVVVEQGAAPLHDSSSLDAAMKRRFDPNGVLPQRTAS